MATKYIVLLQRLVDDNGDEHANKIEAYIPWGATTEANNAEQACRRLAERMEDLDEKGVTLIAIPFRNWTSGRHTFAAKTERKLIRS